MNPNLHIELKTEQSLIPAERTAVRIVEIHLTAPDALLTLPRSDLNLALVLDRSGSMEGEKLEQVKRAACHVLDLLGPNDTVSVVAFDNEVLELAPASPVTPSTRDFLKGEIQKVTDRGGTDLGSGWLHGCQMAAAAAVSGTLNRALLLTDGQANQGITDPSELGRHAAELRSRGISTTTFGVGLGFNEHLLEHMAEHGGGNFYFIENPRAIPQFFAREFDELSRLTAKEIEVRVELPRGASVADLDGVSGGYSFTNHGSAVTIQAGSLTAGAQLSLFLRVTTPPQADPTVPALTVRAAATARGEGRAALQAQGELVFSFQPSAVVESAPADEALKSRFAVVDMADQATLALEMERKGEGKKASDLLKARMARHGSSLSALEQNQYTDLSQRMEDGMEELDRKTRHQQSYLTKKQKS